MEKEEQQYTGPGTPLGARGASLEDSYRHVLKMRSSTTKQQTPKTSRSARPSSNVGRQEENVIPSKLPTHDEYATNMYRLSQFEPVYHDLENEGSRRISVGKIPSSSPPLSSRSFELSTTSAVTSSTGISSSHRNCWPASSYASRDSPVVSERFVRGNKKPPAAKPYRSFSSPRRTLALSTKDHKALGTVPKERTATAVAPPKHKPNASPDEDVTPILAWSDPFDTSSVVTGMSQQELLRRKARAEKKLSSFSQRKNPTTKRKKDRILNLPSSLLGGSKKPPVNKHYAEINIKKSAVVPEETREVSRIDINPASSAAPSLQEGPTQDDSEISAFPILSKHSSFELVDEQSEEEDHTGESRSVRFSKNESSTHIFNDSSDRPSDESDDDASEAADEVVSSYLAKPTAAEHPPSPPSRRSFQSLNSSSSGRLTSILRPARFSPTKASSDSRDLRLVEGEGDEANKSISKSPPQGGTGFVEAGVELSPIVKGNRHSTTVGTGGCVTFHENVEEAVGVYPDPGLDAPTDYSDPTLDVTGVDNTDDDSMMSNGPVGFIQNVASIVIQTSFRRYQAKQFVESLRRPKQLSPTLLESRRLLQATPTPPKGAHIRSTLPLQDHARHVRESLGLPHPQSSQYSDPIVDTSPLKSMPAKSMDGRPRKRLDPLEERLLTLAAVQIQSLFRGFWVRDCLNVDHYCATLIQRAYRSHCCRMEYDFHIYRIVIVQSVWRRQLARLRASRRRALQVEEQRSRSRPVRIMIQRRYDDAAVLIQKQWRAFYYETNYLKTLLDVLLVQTAVRRWFAIRKVNHLRAIQQRLKRRHRYVVAVSRRRISSRATHHSPVAASTQPSSNASKSKPAIVTPKRFMAQSKPDFSSAQCGGSVTCSISDASDDAQGPISFLSDHKKNGSSRWSDATPFNRKPPLPVSTPKVAVVTPRPWPPAKVGRYAEEYSGGSSTGSTSALSEDDVRNDPASPTPAKLPFVIDEGSPGGAKAILSMWRERDKKNSSVEGK